ncbi:ASTRA complex subunit [Orbilia blumenaviensis]|uniref:ASTRA-associated protein 1 n=1 Tax=Orbilia blumenaviensis TaxID=1796055 RepID=A0AAV9VRX7_9PEZI
MMAMASRIASTGGGGSSRSIGSAMEAPVYVIRGHPSPVHALHFYRSNSRLLSADAEGWIVLWDLPIRRPVAVWKGHDSAVLGVTDWDDTKILTHGRDNKIYVWQVRPEDEPGLDTRLPATSSSEHHRPPWLLHSLDVNALNFCAFAMCMCLYPGQYYPPENSSDSQILLAVPSSKDPNTIDIYHLPSQTRVHATVGQHLNFKTGMPMALRLFSFNSQLTLLAGYESGHAIVFTLDPQSNIWHTAYSSKPHTQPVLSLDYHPHPGPSAPLTFYTSSADSIIAKHEIQPNAVPANSEEEAPSQIINTRHAGQQGLNLRSDGRIFATAGWDSRIRVYNAKNMKEVAVLKWHREGCYAVAFSTIFDRRDEPRARGEEIKELAQANDTITTVSQQREERTRQAHVLAAGSKDGRISLWEIF